MKKAQLTRVEALPCKAEGVAPRAVDRIPYDRVPDRRHVYADLMRTACLQTARDEGVTRKRFQYPVMRYGGLPCAVTGHAFSVMRIAPDGRAYCPLRRRRVPTQHGVIDAVHGMVGKLCGQALVRSIVFCRDKQAGRIPVDAVYDSGAQNAAYAGKTLSAVVQKRVDERTVGMSRRRMHHHALRVC